VEHWPCETGAREVRPCHQKFTMAEKGRKRQESI
jgi:hypothetical protein